MRVPRRNFLAGSAALTASTAFGLGVAPAHAQFSLGDMKIDSVSDGSLTLPGGFIFDPMPKDELLPILERYGQSAVSLTPPCNATLIRQDARTILIDVGSGPDFAPNSGKLLESLDALGVTPDDITDIIFTHAHPDHLWGVLDDFDDPLFPEATYRIGQAEWDYWMNPNTVHEIGDARASFAVGAQRRLETIEDRVSLFKDGDVLMPGISAKATFGHTPGHMALEVHHGADTVMILGDSIGNDHIAFAKPGWKSGSDQDQELAATTRVSLMDQLSHEKTLVIGYHLTGNGLGYIDKTSDGYAFVAKDTA